MAKQLHSATYMGFGLIDLSLVLPVACTHTHTQVRAADLWVDKSVTKYWEEGPAYGFASR
jgi:hypothetical protein